jgi:hypothetical protein
LGVWLTGHLGSLHIHKEKVGYLRECNSLRLELSDIAILTVRVERAILGLSDITGELHIGDYTLRRKRHIKRGC